MTEEQNDPKNNWLYRVVSAMISLESARRPLVLLHQMRIEPEIVLRSDIIRKLFLNLEEPSVEDAMTLGVRGMVHIAMSSMVGTHFVLTNGTSKGKGRVGGEHDFIQLLGRVEHALERLRSTKLNLLRGRVTPEGERGFRILIEDVLQYLDVQEGPEDDMVEASSGSEMKPGSSGSDV